MVLACITLVKLCLDSSAYEDEHKNISIRVSRLAGGMDESSYKQDRQYMQDFQSAIRGQIYQQANLYYLEHDMMKFNSSAGKAWHVYGSPVRQD